jgi:hypothetical protein
MIVVTGCVSKSYKPPSFVIKNLDSVDRMLKEVQKKNQQQQRIVICADFPHISIIPYFTPLSSDLKFIIDPNAKLEVVANYMKTFINDRRLEFWTTYGIFIVSAPDYIGKRMGKIGGSDISINVEYTNSNKYSINITNGPHVIKKKADDLTDTIAIIFKEIKKTEPHYFVNVSFFLSPNAKWGSVELIMARMFKHIDSFRGFRIGYGKNDMIKIHFNDIYKYEIQP